LEGRTGEGPIVFGAKIEQNSLGKKGPASKKFFASRREEELKLGAGRLLLERMRLSSRRLESGRGGVGRLGQGKSKILASSRRTETNMEFRAHMREWEGEKEIKN